MKEAAAVCVPENDPKTQHIQFNCKNDYSADLQLSYPVILQYTSKSLFVTYTFTIKYEVLYYFLKYVEHII